MTNSVISIICNKEEFMYALLSASNRLHCYCWSVLSATATLIVSEPK
jgi:hypothetical protein